MDAFVSGQSLNRAFYDAVVAPIVAGCDHSAALLGWGSDVLGYDTVRSTDHGWGPRLQVFVAENDVTATREALDLGLPAEFGGWPVRYGWDATPVRHHVEVTTLGRWLHRHLGRDPRAEMAPIDWLLTAQQQLLGVVRGAVYHDEHGELAALRRSVSWFPDDVWRWLIACQWHRVAQEEAFTGRTAEVGDDLGSRLVAARLVRELMRLVFLFSRAYWPYTKWFGSAFAELPLASGLQPLFTRVLEATRGAARERALGRRVGGCRRGAQRFGDHRSHRSDHAAVPLTRVPQS